MKIYTIRDIAEIAGVSVTTVSRVLNHRPDVSKATRRKVEQVMAECNFVGNANARGLKQSYSPIAALILRGRSNPFLSMLAETMLRHAAGTGTSYLLESIDEKGDEFQTALRLMQEKRAAGFIFVGSRLDERCQVLSDTDVPMVFATVSAEGSPLEKTASSVTIDNRAMGRKAMEALIAAGHRKIAIFGGSRDEGDALAMRYLGARDACTTAGIELDESRYVETRFSLKEAYEAAREFFALRRDTTAVFAMSDMLSMGVMRALKDLGLRVPEDVSVVGFDGVEMSDYYIPRLSTVVQPVETLAQQSVDLLQSMMEDGAECRHVTLEARLALRESIACPHE